MAERQIDYTIRFNINKASLSKINSELDKTIKTLNQTIAGGGSSEELSKSVEAAKQLKTILNSSWKNNLNQLDLKQVHNQIEKTFGSIQNLKASLADSSSLGANAYNEFSKAILNTNLQLSKSSKLLDTMADTLSKTVRWGIASRLMNNMVGSIEKAWSYSIKLDSSLNDIRIVTGKSADEMERFAVTANKAAKALGASTRDYTEASLIYYQQGLSDEEAQRRAEITLKTANVTGQAAKDVSEQLTAVWNGYNVTLDKTELYVDKLAAVAASTAADLEELSTGMSRVASAANVMGVDIDQLTAQLSTIVSVTRQAPESVGVALRTIYARMGDIKAGIDSETTLGNYTSKMAQLGINVLDANGALRDMGEVIEEVGSKWQSMTTEQQVSLAQIMAGTRQYNNLLSLFNNWDMYTKALETSANAAGTLQKQQDTYMESTEAHLQKLSTEAEKTYDILFDTKTVNQFTDALTGMLSVFNVFLKGLGGGTNDFIYFGAVLSNIFNKQIAGGITNAIQRIKEFNENQTKINLMQDIVKAGFGTEGASLSYIEKENFWRASNILKIKKNISNEEFNELNTLRQEIFAYEKIAKKIEGKGLITKKNVVEAEKNLSIIQEEYQKVSSVGQQEKENKRIAKERQDTLTESLKTLENIVNVEEFNAELTKAIADNDKKALLSLQERLKTYLQTKIGDQEKEVELLQENIGRSSEGMKNFANAKKEAYNTKYSLDKEKSDTAYLVEGLSMTVQLITSISGITKTFFDDNLTPMEKMSQILSVVATNLTMILLYAKDLKNIGEVIFSHPELIAIAAVLGGIALTITAIVDASQEGQREIEKLQEAAQKFTEEAEKLKTEIEDIKDTFDKYDSIQKTLEACVEGSEAWNKAIEELNQNILDLLEKYPDLLKIQDLFTRDELTNALTVNPDILNDYMAQLSNQQKISQIASLTSGIKADQLINENDQKKLIEDMLLAMQSTARTKSTKNILNKNTLNNIRKKLNDNLENLSNLTETEYKQELEKIGINKKYIDSLVKFQSQIDLSTKNTNELADKLKNTSILIAETDLGTKTSDLEKQIYSDRFIDRYNQKRNQIIKEIDNLSRLASTEDTASLLKRYNEAMGTNYQLAQGGNAVKYSGNKREILWYNGEKNQTFTREEIATGIASAETRKSVLQRGVGQIAQSYIDELVEGTTGISEELASKLLSKSFDSKTLDENTYNLVQSQIDEIKEVYKKYDWKKLDYLGEEWQSNFLESFKNAWDKEAYEQVLQEQFDALLSSAGAAAKDKYGLDEEAFEGYGKYIAEIADESDELADSLEKDGQATGVVVQSIMRMNKGVEELAKGMEDWIDILQNSTKESYEYWEALDGIRKGLANVLDVEDELIDYKFIVGDEDTPGHLEDIQLAAEGNAEAIDRLRDAYADQVILDIAARTDFNSEDVTYQIKDEMSDAINKAQELIPNIEVGASLYSGDFVDQCQAIIDNANMTVEDANAMFAALGFKAEYQEDHQETVSSVPIYRTVERVTKNTIDKKTGTGEIVTQSFVEAIGSRPVKGDQAIASVGVTTNDGKNVVRPQITKLTKKGTGNFNNFSSRNAGGGSPGRSGGGGGGSSKQPNRIDPVEKEKDRYHDVNIQLKQISNELDKLDKQKDKLFGNDLIENLNKQLEYLNQQIDTTNEKMKIAESEAQELQGKLAASGVTFNADGTIGNYAEAYQAQLNYVNGIINQYNSMGAEAQEGFKDTVENAKENFEKFVDNINRYDEVITDLIPGLAADVQEAVDKQIDIQIQEFDMEIEIRLDLAEAERDWNNFKKKIIDNVKDDDILGNAMAQLVDFSSYYKEDDTGAVQALRKQIDNTLKELYQMDETGTSRVYGDNRTAALEDLKKYYDELSKQLQDVLELQEEIHQSYIDMMDEAQEKFDEQIKSYEMLSELINHDMKVISLVYGDEAYNKLSNYYEKQQENYNNQLDFQRQQVQFWEDQMTAAEAGSEAWDEAKEKWAAAVKDLNNLIEKSIENLQDKYLNAINAIFQELNNEVTDGLGLAYVEEEWTLINKNADQYLDTINSLFGIQDLENKYLKAINDTDNINTQKQLKRIMDEELKDLRERDRLTQYDIDRANKKYEIALKQIALEEAQQNKTQMRLRRDTQGNYRYEYISDIEEVQQLQNDLDELYNSLYNFDKENYNSNLNELYDVWKEFQEKMAEAAQINDPEARAERELLIQEQYGDLINALVEKNETLRSNLYDSAFEDLARLYDKDKNSFLQMTQAEQDALMNDLIPYWDAGVQHMADVFAGEGGFIPVCEEAFEDLHNATQEYEDDLKEIEQVADISFDNISNAIDETIDKTQELVKDNNELVQSYRDEMEAIGGVVDELDNLVTKYTEARDAAAAAEKAAYEYWSEQQRQAADAAAKDQEAKEKAAAEARAKETATPAPVSTPSPAPSSSGGDGILNVGDFVTYNGGGYYGDSYGGSGYGNRGPGKRVQVTIMKEDGRPYPIHVVSSDSAYGWLRRDQLSGYDTGGYTGEWGNTGRLALLHQKELVLNEKDTKNLLGAVNIMRVIASSVGNHVLSRLAEATASSNFSMDGNGMLDQNVHIEASFPNVTNSHEIEDALNNLVNVAAQRAQVKER